MATDIVEIEKQELDGMRSESSTAIEHAKQLARDIKDAVTLDVAARFMLDAKARAKRIVERMSKPKKAARAAWQEVVDLETELLEPYQRIENEIIKPAMSRFTTEQDRLRRIEEDRLRVEAKKREEDERLAAAEALEQRGEKEAADVVLNHAVPVAPIVVPKMEQPKGISYRDVWKFRVVDVAHVPREYLVVDETKIGGVVRALKGDTRIEGVEVYSEKVIAGRA